MIKRALGIFASELFVVIGLGCGGQATPPVQGVTSDPTALSSQAVKQNVVDVLPDFRPIWAADSFQDMRIVPAGSSDRVVSCDDWTQIDPTPITGREILSFRLGSPNYGAGHLRTRRQMIDGDWHFFQTTSQVDDSGTCPSIEREIAVVPGNQAGRWLPLAKFTLYREEDDGTLTPLVCQMKRWCCLISIPTCSTNPPCSLPCQGDCIDAGTRDVYPFHWLDQFILIDEIPTGDYWLEHVINPVGVLIESNYDNNSMLFKIHLDQEAGSVAIIQPPDPSFSQCPAAE